MKRTISIFLIAVLMVSALTGCSPSKIEIARDRAVEIGRQFLDYEITADEAIDKLNSIVVYETEKGIATTSLKADISALTLYISLVNSSLGSVTYNDILDKVDSMDGKDYEKWEKPPFSN